MFPRIVLARDRSRNNRDPNFVEVIRMEIRKGLSMGSTKLRQPVGLLGRCHSFGLGSIAHGQTLVFELTLLQAYSYWNPLIAHGQSLVRALTTLL